MSIEHVLRTGTRRGITVLCAGMLLPLLLTTAQAQTWSSTATKALPLVNTTALGPMDPNAAVHIVVALQLNNMSQLKTLIQREATPGDPLYETTLTPAQFTSTYGPTPAQVQAVENYLTSQGFQNLQVEDNNLFVSADATVQQAQTAFNTALGQFVLNGKTVYANTLAAQVPVSLSGTVAAVLGLNNISAMATVATTATTVTVGSGGTGSVSVSVNPPDVNNMVYGPSNFQTAYDAGKTPTGSLTSIAIMAEGDLTGVVSDLRAFEKLYSLPQVPVTIVPTGIASTDTSGADEWDLDSQSSTGIAGNVQHLYFYDASSLTDSDLAIAFNRFATQNVARAANASFGECEVFPYLDGSMLADDEVFAEAAAQGQTVFSSTGDVGAACPVEGTNGVPDSGPIMVSYPASSPYVVAVGGTDLLTNSDYTWNNEIAWYSGGGGISQFEYSMYWQSGIVPSNELGDRGLPDVAMCADPDVCGANIVVGGSQEVVGGTSLSSPLSMGSWARIESAHKNKLGFAAPLFYAMAQGINTAAPALPSVIGFHDIILGNNAGYSATPGWDYTTGLGSFDISQVNTLIK